MSRKNQDLHARLRARYEADLVPPEPAAPPPPPPPKPTPDPNRDPKAQEIRDRLWAKQQANEARKLNPPPPPPKPAPKPLPEPTPESQEIRDRLARMQGIPVDMRSFLMRPPRPEPPQEEEEEEGPAAMEEDAAPEMLTLTDEEMALIRRSAPVPNTVTPSVPTGEPEPEPETPRLDPEPAQVTTILEDTPSRTLLDEDPVPAEEPEPDLPTVEPEEEDDAKVLTAQALQDRKVRQAVLRSRRPVLAPHDFGEYGPEPPKKKFNRNQNWNVRCLRSVLLDKSLGLGPAIVAAHVGLWLKEKWAKYGKAAWESDTLENFARPMERSVASLKRDIAALVAAGKLKCEHRWRQIRLSLTTDEFVGHRQDILYCRRTLMAEGLGFLDGVILSMVHARSRPTANNRFNPQLEASPENPEYIPGLGFSPRWTEAPSLLGITQQDLNRRLRMFIRLGAMRRVSNSHDYAPSRYFLTEPWLEVFPDYWQDWDQIPDASLAEAEAERALKLRALLKAARPTPKSRARRPKKVIL